MNYLACVCPHCEQRIEYPEEAHGQTVSCPTCQGEMQLPAKPVKRSFLDVLKGKVGDYRKLKADQGKLKSALMEVVSDGVLTDEEIDFVRSILEETGLSQEQVSKWRTELFCHAVNSLDSFGLSRERVLGIRQIGDFLGVSENEASKERNRLDRLHKILDIREQGPTPIEVMDVVLKRGEKVFWVQPARLFEEKVVSRRYEGGSRGVSVRVMKGVSFRVGGHRGQLMVDTADVPVSEGDFIITSERFIFRGQAKSFQTAYGKIISIQNHVDGIYFSESNRQKQRKVQYLTPNGDIIVEILNSLLGSQDKT